MRRRIFVAGAPVDLRATNRIGSGGEADVHDIGGGRALKLFKEPGHPDLAGQPHAQEAARRRLADLAERLADFPRGLPDRVVAPQAPATQGRHGPVVGYVMPLVAGADPLWQLGDLSVRHQPGAGNRAVAVLRDLHATVAAVHRAGVVIGDFNDLNVLVAGARAHLIDADSFQYGRWRCTMFTDRFVDPRLCPAGALVPHQPHDPDSDWYAFAAMLVRALLGVGPWGGVHRPPSGAAVPAGSRVQRRLSLFAADIVQPRAAISTRALPDELAGHLQQVFERDLRGPFPPALLDRLRWTTCTACGAEHARAVCPTCSGTAARRPLLIARGRIRAEVIAELTGHLVDIRLGPAGPEWLVWDGGELVRGDGLRLGRVDLAPGRELRLFRDGALVIDRQRVALLAGGAERELLAVDLCDGRPAIAIAGDRRLWAQGGLLYRDGALGPEPLGRVLAGATRLWAGPRLAFGCWRAGRLAIAFSARPDRGGLREGSLLPALDGRAIDTSAVVGDDRAWLFTTEIAAGQTRTRCILVAADGGLLASADDPDWLPGAAGACAVGEQLFVPTDAGLIRVDRDGDRLAAARSFPDTEPFIDAGARLLADPTGLYVATARRILRLAFAP